MSNIDQLVDKHCPEGVPLVRLGDVLLKTRTIDWKKSQGMSFRYIDLSSVDRIRKTITQTVDIDSSNAPSRAQQIVESGDIIFGTTRPTLKRYCLISEEMSGQIASTGYCVLRPESKLILPTYLLHTIGCARFEKYVEDNQQGASYPSISDGIVKAFEFALPPLEVQAEIVAILNKFTELEAELDAELDARKSQYEYYRSNLLSFHGVEPGEVRWIPIGDVCEYRKERSKSSTGNFLYVGVEDLLQERRGVSDQASFVSSTGHDIFMPGDVLLGNIRPYLKKVWRADVEGRTNGDVLVVTPRQEAITEVDTSYLYFLLSSDDFFSYCVQTSKGAKMPRGDKKAILRYEIPLPGIEVQKRIAMSLALFEQLTQSMESGIPAEQTARRKQYDYYRNKLLTFNEMEVA